VHGTIEPGGDWLRVETLACPALSRPHTTVKPIPGAVVRAAAEQYLSDLHHQYLKPAGYRKASHDVSRARDGYVEHFGFQGSAFNDSSDSWRFYINGAVDFPDIAKRPPVRISDVLPDAPRQYDLPEPDHRAFAREIAGLLGRASEHIAAQRPEIRVAFGEKRYWVGF
jgi:hypothetical protein